VWYARQLQLPTVWIVQMTVSALIAFIASRWMKAAPTEAPITQDAAALSSC
jgi:hypothetical protein